MWAGNGIYIQLNNRSMSTVSRLPKPQGAIHYSTVPAPKWNTMPLILEPSEHEANLGTPASNIPPADPESDDRHNRRVEASKVRMFGGFSCSPRSKPSGILILPITSE